MNVNAAEAARLALTLPVAALVTLAGRARVSGTDNGGDSIVAGATIVAGADHTPRGASFI